LLSFQQKNLKKNWRFHIFYLAGTLNYCDVTADFSVSSVVFFKKSLKPII
jgi:hypothetical protein